MEDIVVKVPGPVETMSLPDPTLLDYYKDLNERVIWIDEDIDDYTLNVVKKITQWNREDKKKPPEKRKPIKIIFYSFGGSLDVHNTLIDIIKLSKTPIWGINAGRCMSAAAMIFLSCHKRLMLENASFLFHQGSGAFSGTFGEVMAQMAEYQQSVEKLTRFMVEHTKYTAEEVEENICGEWYIRADEAIEKGVCEEIVKDISLLV